MKIKLKDIYSTANNRPIDYVEEVLSKGIVINDEYSENEYLEIEYTAYVELLIKYNPKAKIPVKPCRTCSNEPVKYPSIMKQLENAAGAVKRIIAAKISGEPIKASEELITTRKGICITCDKWVESSKRCTKCGCKTEWKIQLSTEKCPLSKW